MHRTKLDQEITTPSVKCVCQVELASHEVELDLWGEIVPVSFKTLQLLVSEPTKQAIAQTLFDRGELESFSLVSYWREETDDEPF